MTDFAILSASSPRQAVSLMVPPPLGKVMSSAHWCGGVSPLWSSIVSAAANEGLRKIAPIFYGTNPMNDST